jgi:hypothetical protein
MGHSRLVRLVLFSIVLAGAVGSPLASASGSPGGTESTWSIVSSPSARGVGQRLTSVAAVSPGDAWAVGDVYNKRLGDQQTLTQHWDGAAWRPVPSPSVPRSYNTLTGLAAISSNDVWAVGYTINDQTYAWKTLILHWNGTGWAIVPGASLGTSFSAFGGVVAFASDDVWAVGYNGTVGRFRTLVEHWNGTAWSTVASPSPGVYGALSGVGGASTNDLWAVGYYREGNGYETMAMHWDGLNWTQSESPSPNGMAWLNAVTATGPNDAWAVGYTQKQADTVTMIEHWDGTGWSVAPSPAVAGEYATLTAVTALSPTDVVTVGVVDSGAEQYDPVLEQWDGTAWTRVSSPQPPREDITSLIGVAPDQAGGYWAVGYSEVIDPLTFRTFIVRRSA